MTSVRWVVLGVALLVGVFLVANELPGAVLIERNGRRTWIVTHAEHGSATLRGEVRPDDALVCVRDGRPDKAIGQLVWLYTAPERGDFIWIEGDRIENPPEGGAPRTVFGRDPMGTVFIYCGDTKF
jgi:hypothetical protein